MKNKFIVGVSFILIFFVFVLTAGCSSDNKKNITPDVFENAVFASQKFIYDGSEHSVFVTGTPDGTKITYANNYAIKVGEYRAFAYLEKDGKDKIMTTTFRIDRADIENVTFENLTVTYDGNLKSIGISGSVPKYVEVVYTMDDKPFTGVTDAGTYTVTAKLVSDFYNPLTLSATLTISKAEINGVSFLNRDFVYDGNVKTMAITGTLPIGTDVTYTDEGGNTFTGKTLPGTYKVNAVIDGSNYNKLILSAVLFIDKSNITGIVFSDYSTAYDTLTHNIKISGTLPQGVTVKYTLNNESGPVFENATEVGVYNIVAAITGEYYKKLTLSATLIIAPGRLATVTGVKLDRSGERENSKTGVILSWNSVPNAVNYDVYISYTNGTQAMKFNVTGLNCDIKDKIFTTLCRDDYNVQIMAIPVSGNETYAPSLLSASVLYNHKGRLYAPKNVRIENSRLIWDIVTDADMYEIKICLLNSSGIVVRSWQGIKATSNNESVADIVAGYKKEDSIPAGTYCFQIRASTANNGYWNGFYASDYSSYSNDTVAVD